MPVDISSVLHVLAHELRTPTGIAQGYLRMLLEDRLTDPADRRRAIEQAQKAIARVGEITHESARLAAWFEQPHALVDRVDARTLIESVVTEVSGDTRLATEIDIAPSEAAIPTADAKALTAALVTLAKATARELGNQACAIAARVNGHKSLDVFIGSIEKFASLAGGPEATGATPLGIERGGLGLSLLLAAAVLDTHAAAQWTRDGARGTVGIRLPVEERAHP